MITTIYIIIYCVGVLITALYCAILQGMSSLSSLDENLLIICGLSIIAGLLWPLIVVIKLFIEIRFWLFWLFK